MRTLSYITISLLAIFSFSACSQKQTSVKKPHSTKHTSKARHKATMRTYTVRGKQYHPNYVEVGEEMHGVSSWYGPNFHGKHTSNGEVYNMHARTAAHKTWPMDTMVKVSNLQNGKSTIVRINDRGPFVRGRIIDCSYKAGKEIGLDKMGIAKVRIKVVGFAGKVLSSSQVKSVKKSDPRYRIQLSNFGVQVGAFKYYEGAKVYQKKYMNYDAKYRPIIKKFVDVDGMPLYRVWLMGFGSENEARDFTVYNAMPGAFIIRN